MKEKITVHKGSNTELINPDKLHKFLNAGWSTSASKKKKVDVVDVQPTVSATATVEKSVVEVNTDKGEE